MAIVNPGFYFPFVAYSQHTQVTTTETAGEMSGRAKQLYDLVKKSLPEQPTTELLQWQGVLV